MHTLHLYGRAPPPSVHCTTVYVQPPLAAHTRVRVGVRGANVAASRGVLPRKIQRERKRKGGTGRKVEITFQKDAEVRGPISVAFSLHRGDRPLIKSLLNRITALRFARHVAVIPAYVARHLAARCLSGHEILPIEFTQHYVIPAVQPY